MNRMQKAYRAVTRQHPANTYSFLKASEGGASQRDVLAALKVRGIVAKPAPSCYVGHTAVLVIGNKRVQRRAERIIFGS
jgi:hypothetical protein